MGYRIKSLKNNINKRVLNCHCSCNAKAKEDLSDCIDDQKNKTGFDVIREWLDFIRSSIVTSGAIAIPLGFVYLLSYTRANRIPMPLSLSELPALLMAVFGIGLFFVFILMGFLFMPSVGKLGLFGKMFNDVFGHSFSNKHSSGFRIELRLSKRQKRNLFIYFFQWRFRYLYFLGGCLFMQCWI